MPQAKNNIGELIQGGSNVRVVNRYGSREFSGSVAQICPENETLFHVNSELVFLEVVDSNGYRVAPGEPGRIVITDLHNFMMPFIRYDTGDWAIQGKGCTCGRGLPTIEKIEGRGTEQLLTPSGKAISASSLGHFLFVLNDYLDVIREYQIIQSELAHAELLIVPESNLFTELVKNELKKDLMEFLGGDLHIRVTVVDEIPREKSGKRPIIKTAIP